MIVFDNWRLRISGELGRQFDHLTRRIDVVGVPDGWTWDALVQVGDAFDIINLPQTEDGVGVELTRDQLSVGGTYYNIQLRGTRGEEVRHTDVIQTYVPESLSGDGQWPTIPSEFTQLEQRISEIASHPPVPSEEGVWMIWDADKDEYILSEFVLPEGGSGGPADAVRYGKVQVLTAEEKAQARTNIDALGASELPEAINTALAQAKESGEFDGADGQNGKDGNPGKDGTSVTHSWDGTVLKVTSASGTSSADLKGEPGKDGADGYTPQKGVDYSDGAPGSDGEDGYSPTVNLSETSDGVTITVTNKDSQHTATVKNGKDGAAGADGKTPEKGVDYWTAEDRAGIVSDVLTALPAWEGGSY